MKMLRRTALATGLAFALGACGSEPPPPRFPDIRFNNEPTIHVTALEKEVRSEFRPSFTAPEVEHQFPVPPQRALENWARDHLQATGGGEMRLRITITDASVREVELPKKSGLEGTFGTQYTKRYDARVAMTVELLDGHGIPLRTTEAEARRSESAADDITLNDRDKLWYEMTVSITRDLGSRLDRQIRSSFVPYLS